MEDEEELLNNVFICYSSKDVAVVEKLSRRIRNYVPPKKTGLKRKLKVFRDLEILTAAKNLSDALKKQLTNSRKLALICSPNTLKSEWVRTEISLFIEARGKENIIYVLVNGEWDEKFSEETERQNGEPLFIDVQKNFRRESLRLIAAIYGVDFKTLLREDERRRRRTIIQACASATVLALILTSFYLVSTVQPIFWNRIQQPEAFGSLSIVPILPVHEVAVSNNDPSLVLYFAKSTDWSDDALVYSNLPYPMKGFENFDSLVTTYIQEKSILQNVIQFDFTIANSNERLIGNGTMKIYALLENNGDVRYARSVQYVPLTIPLTLLPKGEHPLNIGRFTEVLYDRNLIDPYCRISGWARYYVDGTKHELEYDLGDDEYVSREEQYWILPNTNDQDQVILGQKLDSLQHDKSFWERIKASDEWVTYSDPLHQSAGTSNLSEDRKDQVKESLEIISDLSNIKKNTAGLGKLLVEENAWVGDFLDAELITTPKGKESSHLLHLLEQEYSQSHFSAPDVVNEVWLMQLSASTEWKVAQLPSSSPIGLWTLNPEGNKALLLSSDKGFFLTADGGTTWTPANFNESGFTNGIYVKTIVTEDATVYGFIDRSSSTTDGENPLFRLETRNWLHRWMLGVMQLTK